MAWKERLDALPILRMNLGRAGPNLADDECIEGNEHDAHYIGSRARYPGMGGVYTISLSGDPSGRKKIIEELSAELGTPLIDNRPQGIWFIFWRLEE